MIEEALILWTEHALLIYSIFWILKLTTTLPGFLLLCTFKNIWIIDYLTCLGAIEWPSKLVRLHSTYVRSNFIFADIFYFRALSDFCHYFLNYVTARKKCFYRPWWLNKLNEFYNKANSSFINLKFRITKEMFWMTNVHITYVSLFFSKFLQHSVEISEFFCHPDFMWNQVNFWISKIDFT